MATAKVLTIVQGRVKEENIVYFPEVATTEDDIGKMVVVNETGNGFTLAVIPEGGESSGVSLGLLLALS